MKLHDRLPDALERIASSITVDDPGPFDPTAVPVLDEPPPSHRPMFVLAAAAAIAIAGVGAIAIFTDRSETPASSNAPVSTPCSKVASTATSH